MEESSLSTPPCCATCGLRLEGKYCHSCGEKKLDPDHDFSIRHFLTETFENFTHFDSKLLRSIWLLFARPGFLTAEFIAGRRVRYLKPIPLFAIAGVLFYLFFEHASAFFIGIDDMNQGYEVNNRLTNTFHIDTKTIFSQKAAAANRDEASYWADMALSASQRSKTWLFLLVPAWGISFWLMFHKSIKWFVPHLIFALHSLTFFVLFDLASILVFHDLLGFRQLSDGFALFLSLSFLLYNVLAIRRVYRQSLPVSAVSAILAMLLFLSALLLYRQGITLWTLRVF